MIKYDVFKIAKEIVKTNQDMISEWAIKNDGVLSVSDEDKKIAWEGYDGKLLNTVFAWDRKNFSQEHAGNGVPRLKDKARQRHGQRVSQ